MLYQYILVSTETQVQESGRKKWVSEHLYFDGASVYVLCLCYVKDNGKQNFSSMKFA